MFLSSSAGIPFFQVNKCRSLWFIFLSSGWGKTFNFMNAIDVEAYYYCVVALLSDDQHKKTQAYFTNDT